MALAIALVAVIFALQNSGPIDVSLGPLSFAAPLALILLLTLAAGVLAGYLSTMSRMFRMGSEIRKLKKNVTAVQLETDAESVPVHETPQVAVEEGVVDKKELPDLEDVSESTATTEKGGKQK